MKCLVSAELGEGIGFPGTITNPGPLEEQQVYSPPAIVFQGSSVFSLCSQSLFL